MLCTVGLMAAAYFFFVKPALDTTKDVVHSVSQPIKEAQQQAEQAKQQLQQDAKQGGGQTTQVQIQKLQRCIQKAGQNVDRLQACASRFGP